MMQPCAIEAHTNRSAKMIARPLRQVDPTDTTRPAVDMAIAALATAA